MHGRPNQSQRKETVAFRLILLIQHWTDADSVIKQLLYTSIRPFYNSCATSNWLRRGQNSQCIMGKCRQTHAAKYEITLEHVSNGLKMWIKRFQTEIHNKITIYIHNRSICFKIITCIILGWVCLVISNVVACETNSDFSDFVVFCVNVKRNLTWARVLWNRWI